MPRSNRCSYASIVGAAVTAALATGNALAQQDSVGTAAAKLAPKGWTAPRTANGRPDLQGTWTNKSITPFERPAELGDKEFFTAQEAKEFVENLQKRGDRDNRTGDVRDVLNAYNEFWWDSGSKLLPTMLDAQRAAVDKRCEQPGCAVANSGAMAPADEPQALDLMTRCISFGTTIPMLPTAYNNNYQIVQTDDAVGIVTEMVHQVRRIPTKATPPLPAHVKQWFGDPRGRWDGDTLVVETTNFKGEFFGRMAAADENLRVVERFTRVAPDVLLYEFTVDDPTAWTAKWSGEIPLTRTDGLLYEYACHEGNRGMENILRAARKEIRDAGAP
jgi:hypothetical protein